MRRLLVPLMLCIALLASAGCSEHARFGHNPDIIYSADPSKALPLQPGKYGGELNFINSGDPKTFNVWISDDLYSSTIAGLLYDSLEARNPYTLKFEPRLAPLPNISANGLVYTYTLRPNLKWSDGQPITADDVIFTLDVIFDPKVETLYKEGMEVAVAQPDGTVKLVAFKYKKIDDRTVQFTLPERWAPAEEMFSFNIAPKHALNAIYKAGGFNSAWGIDTPPSQIIGDGPFVMSQYVPGQRVVYKPNPYFWKYGVDHQHLPYLDTYTYTIVEDQNGESLNFRSGASDTMLVPLNMYPSFARYARRDNYTMVNSGPDWGTAFITFNENPDSTMSKTPQLLKLFLDKRFRQACSYATDRQTIIDNIYLGLAKPLYGPVTPADLNFFDKNAKTYPYNPAKAKQLLLDMGCTPGAGGVMQFEGQPVKFTLLTSVESPNGIAASTIMENNLRAVGINMTVVPVTFDNLDTKISSSPYDWQAVLMGFGGGPEPNDIADLWRTTSLSHIWHPHEKTPATAWEARINDDFTKGAESLNLTDRKKYYDDWQETVADQQPMVYIYDPELWFAVRNHYNNVQPASDSGQTTGITWNVEEISDLRAARPRP